MKGVLLSVLKNLVLVFLVVITVLSFLFGLFVWTDLLAIQLGFGLVYVFINCYEYLNTSYLAEIPKSRFAYFPYSFFAIKVMKALLFISLALMLLSSGTRIRILYPVCLIIAITELIIMFLKYYRKLCFVSIYANYIMVSRSIIKKVFAKDVVLIEFRHEILYIIQQNNKVEDIRLVNIENKSEFIRLMKEWILNNDLTVTQESQTKLENYV